MEAIVFIGIQGTGKSSFYQERFSHTHIRLNSDMLKTKNRLQVLFKGCLEARQPFVLDNTNVTKEVRAEFIATAKAAGFRVVGYYFRSDIASARSRNENFALASPARTELYFRVLRSNVVMAGSNSNEISSDCV